MAATRARLGRGLSALLGEVDAAAVATNTPDDESSGEKKKNGSAAASAGAGDKKKTPVAAANRKAANDGVRFAPIAKLQRNPDQPRKRFDESELDDLAASIQSKGLLSPILVRPIQGRSGEYQIVAGERRWRAAQKAGLHDVPIIAREMNDREVLEIGIIENVQRQDLNPIEEARGYQALIDQFGHTQEEIAKGIGKSRSHVANCLRLLALPERVLDMVYDNKLTAGHARAIASAPDPEALAEQIADRGLNVREAEALAREATDGAREEGAAKPGRPPSKDADTLALEREVADTLGLDVDIRHRGPNGGEVRVRYRQLEQLEDICRRLKGRTASRLIR